jgi:NitT/TauT family transport system ATP-binding protein
MHLLLKGGRLMSKKLVEVTNVNKTFLNGTQAVHVLDDVSFHVKKGEIVTLLGKSGCGKSTLLNMVGGFEKADEGSVTLDA